MKLTHSFFLLLITICVVGCTPPDETAIVKCDPDNGGLTLPDGCCPLMGMAQGPDGSS